MLSMYPTNPTPNLRKTCEFRQADVDAFLTAARDGIAAKLPGTEVDWTQLYDQHQKPTGAILRLNGHKVLRMSYRENMNPHLMADSFYQRPDGNYMAVNNTWMSVAEFLVTWGSSV